MKVRNIIDKEMFSMKFTEKLEGTSEIMFGGYNEKVVDGNDIIWERNIGVNRWILNMTNVYFGEDKLGLHRHWIEITTTEPHLRMYRDDFYNIETKLRNHFGAKNCEFASDTYLFYCYVNDESLDPFEVIEIHLEKAIIYVEPHEYVKFVDFRYDCRKWIL